MAGSLIVLEGLDGTGKTAIGQALATAIGAMYIASPPIEYNLLRKYICTEGDYLTRFFYFLSANLMLSNQIKEQVKNHMVVCSRYIYSTLADLRYYWQPRQSNHNLRIELERICLSLALEPRVVIYLICEEKERLRRIQNRPQNRLIESDNFDPLYGRIVHEAYSEMAKENWIRVDTSQSDIATCVDTIVRMLP